MLDSQPETIFVQPMTSKHHEAPELAPALLQAVALLTHATGPNPKLDLYWFSQWKVWLQDCENGDADPSAMRLRHALALFAVQAIEDQDRPYNQEAVACIALYLQSLCRVRPDELREPMWKNYDDIEHAYEQIPHTNPSPQENDPWTPSPADKPMSSFLVLDVIIGVVKTINFKVQLDTPYRHCAPLLMRLLNCKDWDPYQVIAHFRSMRQDQFEILNQQEQDLPGESQTVQGILAMHLFSYMHSFSWKPSPSAYLPVLDSVVWDVLCLTGMGNQAPDWLETLKSALPRAGLDVLQVPSLARHVLEADPTLFTTCTPSFSSLRAYAAVASQDHAKRCSRAQWFERRYHRLAHAMATLLKVLPPGARQAGDWDALNDWWKMDVQGLPARAEVQSIDLPADFE